MNRTRLHAAPWLLACALLYACGERARTGDAAGAGDRAPGDTPVAAPAGPSTDPGAGASPDPVVESFRARVPAGAFVRRGACPFECCTYGEWTAEAETPVHLREGESGAPAFTMPAGQVFRADSGNVRITGLLVVAVEDSVGDPPYWSFARGDTLVVLDYLGEGHYNVWHEGAIRDVEGFWGVGARVGSATTRGRWSSEWWVHVRLPDGRSGWVLVEPPARFRGADACG